MFQLLYFELASIPSLPALSIYPILHGASARKRLSAVRMYISNENLEQTRFRPPGNVSFFVCFNPCISNWHQSHRSPRSPYITYYMGHRLVRIPPPCECESQMKAWNKRDSGRPTHRETFLRFSHVPTLVFRIGINPIAPRALHTSHTTWRIDSYAFLRRANVNLK